MQEFEIGADFVADVEGVFADAAGEAEGVDALEGGCVGAALFGDLIGENFDGEDGGFVAFFSSLVNVAHVGTEV